MTLTRFGPALLIGLLGLCVAVPALAAPPVPGLVAAYSFDEGSGASTFDASGNGRTGALTGASWTEQGRYGGALSFDGTDDYVGLPALGTFYNNGFTLEAWVRPSAAKSDVGIVGSWNGSGPMIWIDHLATRYHVTLGGSFSTYLDSGLSPAPHEWRHVAASFDGTVARFYLDGVEIASRAVAEAVGSSNGWRIGAYGAPVGGFFAGSIDEVRVYDRALTAAEISADRDTPLGIVDPGGPTEPSGLAVTGRTPTSIDLSWSPSSDDVAVAGYNIYFDGAAVGTTTSTSFTQDELVCSHGYLVEVEAFDGEGNVSRRTSTSASTATCGSTPGLVAAYGFDASGSGTTADGSGNGRTGLVNGASWLAGGRHGGALSFDGVDDHVALPALGTFYNSGYTLEAWVRKRGSKKDGGLVGTWSAQGGPMLWVDHASGRHYGTLGNSFDGYLDSGVEPLVGQWQHVAVTFDGSTARYYVDGVEVASRSALSVGGSNTWRIGAYGTTPGGFLDGDVDDVRIYSRALAPGEVLFDRDHAVVAVPTPPDATAPSAPGPAGATASAGQVSLAWAPATDNYVVLAYNVHRSASPGFAPSAANWIARVAETSHTDVGLTPGTYYYKLTAEDEAGNVGPAGAEIATAVPDVTPPTAPGTLTATGGVGKASLSWAAATDDVGVLRYNVHRSTSSGFTPSAANRIGQPAGTAFTNFTGAGTYYYKVQAEDAGGNLGPASNQVSAVVTADTAAPTVSVNAPAAGATVAGPTTLSATAADNVAVAGVQFRIDGVNLGPEDVIEPYTTSWSTYAATNGSHTITAVARDPAGNLRTSTAVAVTVSNPGVSTTGLLLTYALDATSGTNVADWSGNGNNGTASGSAWAAGYFGNAASFDGVNDRVDLPSLGAFYNDGFTLQAWVRKSSTKKDVVVLGSWVFARSGGPMIWVDHQSGRYRLTIGNSSVDTYLDSGRAPTVAQWEHVAATYDGTTARFYVDGTEVASKNVAGSFGLASTWRLGAYEATPTGFFDGRIDNVRVYARALSPSEIQVDMLTPVRPETVPPTVTATDPANGAAGMSVGKSPTVTFSEGMSSSTITTSTFQLRDSTSAVVPATVSYDAATKKARLTPQAALTYGESYTVTVKGGTSGVKDAQGNPLASDFGWSFGTETSAPQLLVLTSTARPFGFYVGELLKAEGLNSFTTLDIAFISPALLNSFDVVLLGESVLSATQVSTLSSWVSSGGNLIAMRPDKQLAGLLGLTVASGTRSNAYLRVNTGTQAGAGIVGTTIQYHGTADNYTLNGATAVATLYTNTSTATSNPAVSLRSVGSQGGEAAAFAYDLARSVVYTRQGNPSWAGQERDGVTGIRPDDMFYSSWLNTARVDIPQADEQQRLLANLITRMNADRMPMPRLWYLPRGEKAVVVMSGDDHSPTNAPGGTQFAFDRFKELSPAGCDVDAWECVRATSYIYPNSVLTAAQADAYAAEGFEIGLHPVVASCPTTPLSKSDLSTVFTTQLAAWNAKYGSLGSPRSSRTHCVYWPDWSSSAEVELANGIRLDANYYHYPNAWLGARPGFLNGGGFPMRFATAAGVPIDVFQQNTNLNDEVTTAYQMHIATLLDNALGPKGYYGAFGMNMHTDNPGMHPGSEVVVEEAQARGVPVISYAQLLDWVDARDRSTVRGISWNAGTFTFDVSADPRADGLQVVLPTQGPSGTLTGLSRAGSAVPYSVQTIKGVQYAIFSAATGTFEATYG